jgi:hypothetical protein
MNSNTNSIIVFFFLKKKEKKRLLCFQSNISTKIQAKKKATV